MQGGNDVQILVDKKWKLPHGVTCDRCVLQVTSLSGQPYLNSFASMAEYVTVHDSEAKLHTT